MSERAGLTEVVILGRELPSRSETSTVIGATAIVAVVTAIHAEGLGTAYSLRHRPEAADGSEAGLWPIERARRLLGVFASVYGTPDSTDAPDCFEFVDRVMDWPPLQPTENYGMRPVNPARMITGMPYGIRKASFDLSHAMLGLATRKFALSVAGKRRDEKAGGDLIISDIDHLMDTYRGVGVMSLTRE